MHDAPYIDMHTHAPHPGALCVVSYAIGSGEPFPEVHCISAGVHPWDAENIDMDEAIRILNEAPIAAVGEIGLDFSRQTDRKKQTDVLKLQLAVAEERDLPVILHCVKAYNEILEILSEYDLRAVIFHGYIGSPELTTTITNKGYYVSIGERSLKSRKTIESIRTAPIESIFAETDVSNLPIENIYHTIAGLKRIEVKELKRLIFSNFKKAIHEHGC